MTNCALIYELGLQPTDTSTIYARKLSGDEASALGKSAQETRAAKCGKRSSNSACGSCTGLRPAALVIAPLEGATAPAATYRIVADFTGTHNPLLGHAESHNSKMARRLGQD